MVDQEIRVLGDENIIANPKNSQKQYPLTFKAVPNVIVYGRKKDNLNFTVPIPEGVNFNFNLDRTSIIFSDNFNLEEYSYIMVKNPFEEIQDFFYVSSLEELDPTGKEFNEFNDEVVKWLRRLVNIISNRCMIFETTLFKDLNNFPNIKSGQTFIRTEDGWTGITIRDINSELDVIFNKYVEEVNKKIQEHQVQMNELLEQWKQDIQKYAENVKQYEIVRIVTQSGHGFIFEPVMYSISQRKFVKALFPHGADGIAVRVDDNNFRLVWAGRVEIPATAKDTQQRDFVLGEYYFLGEGSNGGIQREKPDTYYQHLFQVMYSDELQQNIADVLLSVPINQKGKHWDVGEAKTTVNDIEELKMSDFPVGKVVEVLGYYKAGDGADHKRIISSADDGSGVQLSNGKWANIVHNGEANVSWFGVFSLNRTDYKTTETQKVLNYFRDYKDRLVLNFDKELWVNNKIECIWNKTDGYEKELKGSINGEFNNLQEVFFKFGLEMTEYGNIANKKLNLKIFLTGDCKAVLKLYTQNKNDLAFWHSSFDLDLTARRGYGLWVCNGFFENRINRLNVSLMRKYQETDNLKIGEESICYVLENQKDENIISSIKHDFINTWGGYNSIITKGTDTFAPSFAANEIHLFDTVSNAANLNNQGVENYINLAHIEFVGSKKNDVKASGIFWNGAGRIGSIEGGASSDDYMINFLKTYNETAYNFSINSVSGYNSPDMEYYVVYDGKNFKNTLVLINNNYDLNNKGKIRTDKYSQCYVETSKYLCKLSNGFLDEMFDKTKNYFLRSNGVADNLQGFALTQSGIKYIHSNRNIYETDKTKDKGYYLQFSESDDSTNIYNKIGFFGKLSERKRLEAYNVENAVKQLGSMLLDLGLARELVGIFNISSVNATQLNTPYHVEKMQQEGVYNDFITYMDEKTFYDKQQRKLEQDRQLAYKEALKENPELTFEEFMSVQPMALNLVEEPQPSDALKKFMDKYL